MRLMKVDDKIRLLDGRFVTVVEVYYNERLSMFSGRCLCDGRKRFFWGAFRFRPSCGYWVRRDFHFFR